MSRVKVRIPYRLTADGKFHWDDVKGAGSDCTKVIAKIAQIMAIETLGPATESMNESVEVSQQTEQDKIVENEI